MGKVTGFLEYGREGPERRPAWLRVRDWREVYEPFPEDKVRVQAARCMDCGIPFCHEGCPLGNLIPEWNDLVWRGDWSEAIERLHATNNFPEFTGRLCPAPCEGSCVLGINSDAVAIKQVEVEIAERAFSEHWVSAVRPSRLSGRSVAVVGSGPAGLAAAQQLTRAGHKVVVFERAERPGGLLRYGIPEFKLEKRYLDRRLAQMGLEGTEFRTGVVVGEIGAEPGPRGRTTAAGATAVPAGSLVSQFDAVLLATGSTVPRALDVPGSELMGIHVAMEYLKSSNLVTEGRSPSPAIDASGKRVVIIGGGDTGADCLGTAHRQGAVSVHQLEILERPPDERPDGNPWPTWPLIFRTSSAHEEGGMRLFGVETVSFLDDGAGGVRGLALREVRSRAGDRGMVFEPVPGSESELACDLVLLALGFTGPEQSGLVRELGIDLDTRGNLRVGPHWMTSREGVFACGDAVRGQSLVVWAIAEGRSAAASVDRFLAGDTALSAPLAPGQMAIR